MKKSLQIVLEVYHCQNRWRAYEQTIKNSCDKVYISTNPPQSSKNTKLHEKKRAQQEKKIRKKGTKTTMPYDGVQATSFPGVVSTNKLPEVHEAKTSVINEDLS